MIPNKETPIADEQHTPVRPVSKMKLLLLLAIGFTAAAAANLFRGRPDWDDDWKQFKSKHGRKYKDAAEEAERRSNWERKKAAITKHNEEASRGDHSFFMAENHFSDKSAKELKQLNGDRDENSVQLAFRVYETALDRQNPLKYDLRNDSCMPAIKDQGSCGSCWAFAATTPVEFRKCKATGVLKTLSEQQLVDCSSSFGNYACDGGNSVNAWKYIMAAPGQASSNSYLYTDAVGTCKYTSSMSAATVKSYAYVSNNTAAIESALISYGPLKASIYVIDSFYSYSSGIYDDATCPNTSTNHAVVIVGYGTENNIPYWVVRNSWNTWWGELGYFRIRKGINRCCIENKVYSVVV